MKKLMVVFLLAVVAMFLLTNLGAMAEVVDAAPDDLPFNPSSPVELLDQQVLATFGGMVALTMLLSEGIKLVIMKNFRVDSVRIVVFIISTVVVVMAKLIGPNPLALSDMLLIPGNAIGVWLSATKLYERFFGAASTPAGPTKV